MVFYKMKKFRRSTHPFERALFLVRNHSDLHRVMYVKSGHKDRLMKDEHHFKTMTTSQNLNQL